MLVYGAPEIVYWCFSEVLRTIKPRDISEIKSLNGDWEDRELWISFLLWLPPSSPKIDTHNKTRTAIWVTFQTLLRGSVIASLFMQAVSLLRKYIRLEIHRKVCVVCQRGKSVPVLYQLFIGRGLLPSSWKQGSGRKVDQAGRYRGIASRQRWNNCFFTLFTHFSSPCNTVSVVKYGKAKGKVLVHAKT